MFYYLYIIDIAYFVKAALKVMFPVILYWPTVSKMHVGGMAVEAETFKQ